MNSLTKILDKDWFKNKDNFCWLIYDYKYCSYIRTCTGSIIDKHEVFCGKCNKETRVIL